MWRLFSNFNVVSHTSQSHPVSSWPKSDVENKPPRKAWYWLFLAPFIGLLWPALYAKTEPMLFGFPFFYWYQFAWVLVSAVLTGIVYLATRRR